MDGSGPSRVSRERWLESIKIELAELSPPSSNWRICRVPIKLQTVSKEPYIPHMISIGPFHHRRENVLPMEDHKLHYMLALLERTQNAVGTLDACGKTILRFDKRVRDCYAEPIKYSDIELARMLLIDGCFILELFLRYSMTDLRFPNDPIFTTYWMISSLQRDLALLENQIPFFVLEWLFDIIVRHSTIGPSSFPLPDLALRFFKSALDINEEIIRAGIIQHSHHLLDLIHKCYLPSSPRIQPSGNGAWEFIHCATALAKAGIGFEKDSTKHLFDLNFRSGVLKIPPLRIQDSTDSLFRNLIAFEQCFRGSTQYITSYVLLMDRLVDTTRDVELLQHRRIIENDLGACEDVTALFNNICKQVVLQDFYHAGLCEQVSSYYNTRWNKYKAALKRDHFTNPWTIISLVAGFLLLSFTALQAVYSVLSYYPH